jgi:hypothetical protein
MAARSVVRASRAGAVALAVVLLAPAAARAESHRGDLGAGASYASGRLFGAAVTGNWTLTELPETGAATARGEAISVAAWEVGVAAELGYASGTVDGVDDSRIAFLVGPRFTLARVNAFRRVTPFGEVLAGTVHRWGAQSETHLGGAFGVGFDVPLGSLASPDRPPTVALRARYAKHWINENKTSWYDEAVVGVVYRFTKK